MTASRPAHDWIARQFGRRPVRRLIDRFGAEALDCKDMPGLNNLVADASKELGFDHFAILQHASLGRPRAGYFRFDNYPEGWAAEIVEGGIAGDDPVHCASTRLNTAFGWNEVGSIIALTSRQRSIFDRGRRHGLSDGITIPANVPGELAASCSFAVRTGRSLPEGRLKCAELVGAYALRAARRLHGGPRRERPHLSKREVDCLALVALGKSDWEIGAILGIGVETARKYVKRARAAYDVTTRTQLVICGLRDGWISFTDVLPLKAGVACSRG